MLYTAAIVLALGLAVEAILIAAAAAVDERFAATLDGIVGIALHLAKAPAADHRLQAQLDCKQCGMF